MEAFVYHVDDKTMKCFNQEQTRIITRFHEGYSVGRVEDGLERVNPKARREVQWLL